MCSFRQISFWKKFKVLPVVSLDVVIMFSSRTPTQYRIYGSRSYWEISTKVRWKLDREKEGERGKRREREGGD